MGFDPDPGIQASSASAPASTLARPDIRGAEQDLALQIGKAHRIVIHQAQRPTPAAAR